MVSTLTSCCCSLMISCRIRAVQLAIRTRDYLNCPVSQKNYTLFRNWSLPFTLFRDDYFEEGFAIMLVQSFKMVTMKITDLKTDLCFGQTNKMQKHFSLVTVEIQVCSSLAMMELELMAERKSNGHQKFGLINGVGLQLCLRSQSMIKEVASKSHQAIL